MGVARCQADNTVPPVRRCPVRAGHCTQAWLLVVAGLRGRLITAFLLGCSVKYTALPVDPCPTEPLQ